MSDWQNGRLADSIAALDAGVSVNAEDRPHGAGEVGVLKTSAVSGGRFFPAENKAVHEKERRLVAEPVEGDSILVSRMNTPALVGESCYVPEAYPSLFLPDRLWQLKPKDRSKINIRWLSYVLQSNAYRRHVEVHATGTSGSMKNLPKSKLLALPVRYPSLPEQSAIARLLDTLDTAIRETEAIIAKLKAVKQGLLHDLLTRGIDANGELRPPQAEAPHLYKQSPLGWIPNEWSSAPLREYAGVTVAYVGPTNPFYTDKEHGVLFLRTGNITDDGIDLSDVRWVTKAFHMVQKKSALQEGDVVVSRVGYTGTASVVGRLGDVNAANMIIIRPLQMLHPQWVRRLFGADAYIRQVRGFTAGSAQPVLNIDLVYRLMTPLPPRSEQALIIERLNACDFRINSERVELAEIRALKTGLMDDLLTGRVRVNPLMNAEQPAESRSA